MTATVLVADIGGTNARFALASRDDGVLKVTRQENFRAEDFESIRDAAGAYLEAVNETPSGACFAVAAPVDRDEIVFTNSHWRFAPDDVRKALSLKRFLVVNDFYALAAGVTSLQREAFIDVKPGAPDPRAPVLVMGPGTGLGQALIVPAPEGQVIVSTEGGHISFAPRTEEEIAVMNFIAREHPRVSVERLLSGRGLVNIHRALCALSGAQRVSLQANEITQAAKDGTLPIAKQAVDMFCEVLGRVAGDAVLACGARGGVVLGGGILPRIQEIFLASDFVVKFLDKGRMRDYVADAPVRLIIAEGAALYGAAAALEKAKA